MRIVTWLLFCWMSFGWHSGFSQVRVIEDWFEYDKATFDLTFQYLGEDTVKLEEVRVPYAWRIYSSPVVSAGGGGRLKPVAELKIDIPCCKDDTAEARLPYPLIFFPQSMYRLRIGLEIGLEGVRLGLDEATLITQPFLVFSSKDTLHLSKRTLTRDILIRVKRNDQGKLYASRNKVDYKDIFRARIPRTQAVSTRSPTPIGEVMGYDEFSSILRTGKKDTLPPRFLEGMKVLQSFSFPTDTLKIFYRLALQHPNDTIKSYAIGGIREQDWREFASHITAIFRQTQSRSLSYASLQTLRAWSVLDSVVLIEKLSEPGLPSYITGQIIYELAKMKHRRARRMVLDRFQRGEWNHWDVDAYRLVRDTADAGFLLEIFDMEKRKNLQGESQQRRYEWKVANLLKLAFETQNYQVMLPYVKQLMANPREEAFVLNTCFVLLGKLLSEEQRNRISEIFTREIFPLLIHHTDKAVRYHALSFAYTWGGGKTDIEPLLFSALKDDDQSVRKLAAQIIIREDKRGFRPQITKNFKKAPSDSRKSFFPEEKIYVHGHEDKSEMELYCDFLGEDCVDYLKEAIEKYKKNNKGRVEAILNLLKKDSLKAQQMLEVLPRLLTRDNYRIQEKVLELLARGYHDTPEKLTAPFTWALTQSGAPQIERIAEYHMLALEVPGLEEVAVNRLQIPYIDHSPYIQYLGEGVAAEIRTLLENPDVDESAKRNLVRIVYTHLPEAQWPQLAETIETCIRQSSAQAAESLWILEKIKPKDELTPFLEMVSLHNTSLVSAALEIGLKHQIRIHKWEEELLYLLRKTNISFAEIDLAIKYLGDTALSAIIDIWNNPKTSDMVKGKYLQALSQNRDLFSSISIPGAFAYFFNQEPVEYKLFALSHLFFLVEEPEVQRAAWMTAFTASEKKLRQMAEKMVSDRTVKGLEKLMTEELLNIENPRIPRAACIRYLGNDAVPVVGRLLRADNDKEIALDYLSALENNLLVLDFAPLVGELRDYIRSRQLPQDSVPTIVTSTGYALLYMALDHKGLTGEAETFLSQSYQAIFSNMRNIRNILPAEEKIQLLEIERRAWEQLVKKQGADSAFVSDMADAYFNMAQAYLELEAYPEAEQITRKGIALKPGEARFAVNQAVIFLLQKQYSYARAVIDAYASAQLSRKVFPFAKTHTFKAVVKEQYRRFSDPFSPISFNNKIVRQLLAE